MVVTTDVTNCDDKVQTAVEPQGEDRRGSGNLADFDALEFLERTHKKNKSREPWETERDENTHSLTSLMFRGPPSVAERAPIGNGSC